MKTIFFFFFFIKFPGKQFNFKIDIKFWISYFISPKPCERKLIRFNDISRVLLTLQQTLVSVVQHIPFALHIPQPSPWKCYITQPLTKTNAGTWFPRFSDDLRFSYQLRPSINLTRGLLMNASGCVSAGIYRDNPILRTLT